MVKRWLLHIIIRMSVVPLLIFDSVLVLAATSTESPSRTQAEWRELFNKDPLDPKAKTSRPETDRVKILINFSLSMCHMTERIAATEARLGKFETARARIQSAGNCASEGTAALKKQLPKARQELANFPRAVEKLNSFAAAYLYAMSAIPREASSGNHSDIAIAKVQEQDKRKVQEKQAELDVELF